MRRKILFLVIAFITFLCLMTVGHFVFKPSGLDRVTVIDEGWNVRYNDTEYENIRLSDLRELLGHGTFAGDVLILSKELDNLSDYGHPTITFETRFSAYRVLVNGHLLYEEYCDPEYQNRFVGCDNEYITMPALEGTSTAVIELHVTQDGAYSYYELVVLGDFQDVMHFMIYNNLFVFISSVFLIVFGLMFFAIALGFRSVMQDFDIQIYSSLLFITLGIWFLTQFKLLDVFIDTRGHQTEIEYMSLYLAAPLLIMSAGCVYNSLKNRVFYIFISIAVVAAVLPVFLHFTGILYINKFLPIFQAVSMVLLIYMIYLLVTGYRNKKISSSQYIQLVGQALLILSFLFNFIFYLVEKSGLSEQIMLSKKAVPFGALCMAFTTLVNYCLFISDSYAHKKEYQSLAHLAYADGLTNLPNRSRYEKYASDLSRTANDYCIISIDLNGLKGQ